MRLVHINHWSTTRDTYGLSEYDAPELAPLCLQGTTRNHPRCRGPIHVMTSRILGIRRDRWGYVVVTRSGSRYRLGEPDPKWLTWLEKNGTPYDPDNPIKVHNRGGPRHAGSAVKAAAGGQQAASRDAAPRSLRDPMKGGVS